MSKKFYAVTDGEYSDYHIITITDDEQRANNIAKIYDAEVEEYTDDISEDEPITFLVMENGVVLECKERFLPDVEKMKLIYDIMSPYVYVDAFSKKGAIQKAEPLFSKIRKEKAEREQRKREEYIRNLAPSWFAKREKGAVSVIPADCGNTETNTVFFGSRAYVRAKDAEQAFKIACDLFAKYDAERAGI